MKNPETAPVPNGFPEDMVDEVRCACGVAVCVYPDCAIQTVPETEKPLLDEAAALLRQFGRDDLADAVERVGELALELCERDRAVETASDAEDQRATEGARRALCKRGFCGDGDLAAMVARGLDEAEQRGRRLADAGMHQAIQEVEALLDDAGLAMPRPSMTLAERVQFLINRV